MPVDSSRLLKQSISRLGDETVDQHLTDTASFHNHLVNSQIGKLMEIQEKRKKRDIPHDMKKTDTKDLIERADREIRVVSYQLTTIISDGNYHQLLYTMMPNPIEVIENTHIYFKVPCKNLYSPAFFKIKYKSRGDLKIFIDSTNKQPVEGDCEHIHKSPKRFSYWTKDR